MAIPAELQQYNDEATFIKNFLCPLLGRLGFSIIIPYHGAREFGRDLVVCEIDRFNHWRYHGIQAKYEPSISLNGIESLISDCKQAFVHDVCHPQTGQRLRISSFYGINGGTISDQAKEHFFASLQFERGDNIRLLGGPDLLKLDRTAGLSKMEEVRSDLLGVLHECSYNRRALAAADPILQQIIDGNGNGVNYPAFRLRFAATSSYVARPVFGKKIPLESLELILNTVGTINRYWDGLPSGYIATVDSIKFPARQSQSMMAALNKELVLVEQAVTQCILETGPLSLR
ncbi:MAG: hypothetical protein H7Y88_07515 [Phycisphaerales bacterium]|nr:hypothetical protein [Phycisphaerales bacterium]